jgi:hypothetical protein
MVCLAIICSYLLTNRMKSGLHCKELCSDLHKASSIFLSDRTWMESAGVILNLLPRILAIGSSVQQRDVLNAVWAIVYICSKRFALGSLDCIEHRVKRYKQSCIGRTSS